MMENLSVFETLELIGAGPLLLLLAWLLWRIEKTVTIMTVKIEYAVGLKSREDAEVKLAQLGDEEGL
jgi:hypothetical protein